MKKTVRIGSDILLVKNFPWCLNFSPFSEMQKRPRYNSFFLEIILQLFFFINSFVFFPIYFPLQYSQVVILDSFCNQLCMCHFGTSGLLSGSNLQIKLATSLHRLSTVKKRRHLSGYTKTWSFSP
uniref:Ovule protein n=1 Tax=Ascaris lumbricoides TaxID=6252 RepID=A0A0M3I609_ASCLU